MCQALSLDALEGVQSSGVERRRFMKDFSEQHVSSKKNVEGDQ